MGLIENTLKRFGYTRRIEGSALWPDYNETGDTRAWKRLGTGSNAFDRDITQTFLQESTQRAFRAWRLNPFVKRIVEMHVNYVVGEGVQIQANDERVQLIIDSFWNDPTNNLDMKLEDVTRDLSLFGEVFICPFVNTMTGKVKLGYLDPLQVSGIETNPFNADEALYVVFDESGTGKRKLRIVFTDTAGAGADMFPKVYGKDNPILSIPVTTDGMRIGEVFYLSANKTIGVTRGTSDFLPILDWCRSTEDLLFTLLDKAKLQNAVYLLLTVKNATAEQLRRFRDPNDPLYIPQPKSGTMGIKSDNMEYEYLAPSLASADMSEAVRMFKSMIEIGSGVPEHQFGQGGDVNRATALEMGGPFHKMLQQRQKQLQYHIEDIIQFVIDQSRIFTSNLKSVSDFGFTVTMSSISAKDDVQSSATVQQRLAAIVAAKQSNLISDELAHTLAQQSLADSGFEFEPEQYIPSPVMNGAIPITPGLQEALRRVTA